MTTPPSPHFDRPNRIPWPPILLAGVVGAAFALQSLVPISWPGLDDASARLVGLGIGVAGLLLTVWAIATLVRNNTTVMPDKAARHLVTGGPYAWRRNPIYLGEIMMLLGAAELTKNVWFVAMAGVFGMLVTVFAIRPEEQHLEARFGEDWRDYASRTRALL
jgi:protein-S-isoprenylcysteine O-methyltransferase Ste14